MSKITIFNPLSGPVVYSLDGRVLGGGERVEVDSLDDHGKHCVEFQYLTVLDDGEPEAEEAPTKTARKRGAAKDESEPDSGASEGSGGN